MLFALMGFFRPDVEAPPQALQADFNEHLSQPFRRVRLAGPVQDRNGRRIGWMALIESDTFDQAEAYLHESPYFAAHLYERIEVGQYAPEVGTFG